MTMEKAIAKIQSATPIGVSETTGLSVYESYLAPSGFHYMAGVREINDLLIVEQVAEGTACTLLCGILLYHKQSKQLLKEIQVERNFHYSREKTMQLVAKSLLSVLKESTTKEGIPFNEGNARRFIDEMLDRCYLEKSRQTILEWAQSIGIIQN